MLDILCVLTQGYEARGNWRVEHVGSRLGLARLGGVVPVTSSCLARDANDRRVVVVTCEESSRVYSNKWIGFFLPCRVCRGTRVEAVLGFNYSKSNCSSTWLLLL